MTIIREFFQNYKDPFNPSFQMQQELDIFNKENPKLEAQIIKLEEEKMKQLEIEGKIKIRLEDDKTKIKLEEEKTKQLEIENKTKQLELQIEFFKLTGKII